MVEQELIRWRIIAEGLKVVLWIMVVYGVLTTAVAWMLVLFYWMVELVESIRYHE